MRFHAAVAVLLIASVPCLAQAVPTTTVETLSGKKLALPDAIRGHIAILIIGFSHSSKDPTSEWSKNLRAAFGGDQNVQIYEVADIAGAPRMFRGMITSGMRTSVQQDQRDNFFVVTQDDGAWKGWAGFSAADDAYILLVDKSGQQVWKTHGAFNQPTLADLKKRALALETP